MSLRVSVELLVVADLYLNLRLKLLTLALHGRKLSQPKVISVDLPKVVGPVNIHYNISQTAPTADPILEFRVLTPSLKA